MWLDKRRVLEIMSLYFLCYCYSLKTTQFRKQKKFEIMFSKVVTLCFQIMSVVKATTPLKPADTCLETEKVSVAFGDCFR